ncbi:MAG: TIGR04255 family protein [Candidatus Brocadiaceae bacterium]|uniref:TIGR04255 family protein n=1 Tax=Candidatus Wunengus sp. YC61 TaxID=3367698 RepID=UPI002724DD6B|nr:TIGR04255 family protein [Candidatus Brocadiaceae bacterium]
MVSEYTVFPNAPITEALLDIRVEFPEEITLAKIDLFYDSVRTRFPEKQPRISFQAGIKVSSEGTSAALPTSGGIDGYLFQSPHEKKIVQARLDGFTFHKLKPYNKWEVFREEARELWNIYFQITNPVKITRIALRYINRIEIPLPMKDFKEYILTVPEIAPKLPQALNHFFMRLVIPNPEIQAIAIITQTMENPTENQRLPLIFDIDVFQNTTYIGNKAEMWNEFEKLHIFKNEIFFNSITEKTKEFFK